MTTTQHTDEGGELIQIQNAQKYRQGYREKWTRRRFLKLSVEGTLSLAAVAVGGCGRTGTPSTTEAATVNPGDATTSATESALAVEPTPSTTAAPTQSLRIAFATIPTQFDPAVWSTNSAIQLGFTVYEGLVRVDQQLAAQPALAERWEVSEDLLTWTFMLRQDVLFHHGTPFTARDVIYTYQRLLDPAVESPLRSVLSFVSAIEAIDDGTPAGAVRFRLTTANADLPLLCAAPQALVIAHDYAIDALAKSPSGTGPFRVFESIPGQRFSFIRNDQYWGIDQIALQEVHHLYRPAFDERVATLSAGEIDMLVDISSEEAQLLTGMEDTTIAESPSGAYLTVAMQATEAPFSDPRIRQALKLCLDHKAIQMSLLDGRGEIGLDHPVASISPFHADLSLPQRDIAQARQLLIDAGYPDGLQLDLITAAVDPGMVQLATLVQEMAAPAGFDIRPTEVPADVYWSSYWMQVPFHIGSWNFRPSIDETFSIAYHSKSLWNESRWADEELDALLDQARSEADAEQRKALYRQAQQIVMTRGAVMIPVFRSVLTAMRGNVKNFVPHPTGWLDLRGIELAEPTP
ncbi:MAG: ABC transporter substrate-binding protein [Caldilineaceae bacterium]|nr:ABC transporter substrate-binding protein [Caldilineaceae bacterium]